MRKLSPCLLLAFILFACSNPVQNLQANAMDTMTKKTVVLVHGYGKGPGDMESLSEFLEDAGYSTVSVDLPLTFERIEDAAEVFAAEVDSILADLPENQTIAMAGHSTGGLIIRYFLAHSQHSNRVGHAVLIATPNKGSRLAEKMGEFSDLLVETFATLDSLRPENIASLKLYDSGDVKIGAIAGNKGDFALGRLLEKENDGRVEVDSVYYPGLDDFIIVPFNHNEIHHKKETAELVSRFIETGSFMPGFSGFETTTYNAEET
ncbi:MAG: esterase/lipase family protein [Desulfosalsimonas sp.]